MSMTRPPQTGQNQVGPLASSVATGWKRSVYPLAACGMRSDPRLGARHAAARGEDAAGGMHAVNIRRACFDADQDDRLALLRPHLGLVGGEYDDAAGGTWARRQATAQQRALRIGTEHRMQQLVEQSRVDAPHRLRFVDQRGSAFLFSAPSILELRSMAASNKKT
jgi:hypothetical protein